MTDQINITYTPATGDILFTTARQTSGLDEAIKAIGDFIRTLKAEPVQQTVKQVQQVKAETEKAVKKPRKSRSMFNDQQKADIIARYKAGEGPTAISRSLGCSKSVIVHLIQKAGATEGRTGQHLKKKVVQPEPEPAAPAEEPVPVPSAEELEAEDRQRKADLREYRKQHPKPYYLN